MSQVLPDSDSIVLCKGALRQRLGIIFSLHLLSVAISLMLAVYSVALMSVAVVLICLISLLAWLAVQRQWMQVQLLARLICRWSETADPDLLNPSRLSRRTGADVAALAGGVHNFAVRLAGYNQREHSFTRDASHELRSPLTVIKMSTDMLADEDGLSEFGQRSLKRIKRASREMEALVEALLILARESDTGLAEEEFLVNDVVRAEVEEARQLLGGRPLELRLEETVRFVLQGSPRVFAVLCWQLIRNACQQADEGHIVITLLPGALTVVNQTPEAANTVSRHGFELAIVRRISERFAWPLSLESRENGERVASVRFAETLPG